MPELHMISSSIGTLLDGLDRLKPQDSGAVVCEFLKLFRESLSCVTQGAHQHIAHDFQGPSSRQTRSRASASQQASAVHEFRDERKVRPLSSFLILLLSILDITRVTHRNLLDGFMHCLLSDAGKLLNLFVFEDDVNGGRVPGTESAANPAIQPHLRPRSNAAANLVWILERAMVLNGESTSTLRRGGELADSADQLNTGKRKTRLSDILRTKVQNTLLRPLYKGHDATFADVFEKPDLSALAVDVLPCTIEPCDVSNWFKQEIWRIVGWDTLQDKIDWEN